MAEPKLFAHPFSAYCQKVLIALYANATAFDYRMLDPDHLDNGKELARRWPERDDARDTWLRARGVRTVRIAARDILRDLQSVLIHIDVALAKRPPSPPA